ncbi:Hypothetical predicted protein [Paramuricea clavata]|uniref:Uncharacterized protein n=1 Tax=Paramuricea clavata TaxID=317549 RepID=A0A6S7J5I7_PARCT|nr:Hypothetical predicted protein [Paramuricea clavata]
MSEGLVLFHKFLVLILITIYAEALNPDPWETYDGRNCHWDRVRRGPASYDLISSNSNSARSYASITTTYRVSDQVPGDFCVQFMVQPSRYLNLILVIINSEVRNPVDTLPSGISQTCVDHDSFDDIKVSFNVTCSQFPHIGITIYDAKIGKPSTTTPFPTMNGEPTNDVGDIQYVGVVVGAICIALFTLFSCLTIISARRSNHRDTTRRTLPSASCQEEDDRPDVVADNAPPSYDAVMACPDLYPPTPQDSPHATPETTPHLSLHRRALLNQHMGSLPGSGSASPQLHRQSFTHSIASDDLDEIPEYPPPPYPGLANGDVSTSIPENTTDNATEVDNTPGVMPGIENLIVNQSESDSSAASSPNQNSSPLDDQENPWVLNNVGNSHLRDRDHNPPSRVNTEQYPMRARTLSDDSTRSNENSQEESTSSSNSQVIDTTSESAHGRNPKPGIESGSQDVELRVAVV